MQAATVLNPAASRAEAIPSRWPAAGVVLFGVALIYFVGFLSLPQAHNATHDTRHATGFPCH
jgi:cobalt transporter subunit CbtB